MKLINPVSTPDGNPRSFYTYKVSLNRLCRCIGTMPGVEFTHRPKFCLSGEDVEVHFRFKGHDFKIEGNWGDTHVCPKDETSAYPEIVEIQEHVEQHALSSFGKWLAGLFKKKCEDANNEVEAIRR